MKKILLIISLSIFTLITLSSCTKNLKYRYVGAYIELVEVEEKTMTDQNIKVYYNFKEKRVVIDNNMWQYQVKGDPLAQDIKEDKKEYYITKSFQVTCDLDKAKIYPIIEQNGTFSILDEGEKTINLVKDKYQSATIHKSYQYQKEKYLFEITIRILKKEV